MAKLINNPIGNFTSGRLINNSGIGADINKYNATPVLGQNELDGYKETFVSPLFGAGIGDQSIRVFDVLWGSRKQWVDYMLGWSYNVANPGLIYFSNKFSQQGWPGGQLRRSVPVQHPEYPWMYAVKAEMIGGIGAWTNNPNVFLTDGSGNLVLLPSPTPAPVTGGGGTLVQVPMIAYFDTGATEIALANSGHNATVLDIIDGRARYVVTYRALDLEIRNDGDLDRSGAPPLAPEMQRWVTRKETYAISSLPIPNTLLTFIPNASPGLGGPQNPDANKTIPQSSLAKLFPVRELTYNWWDVPDVPEEAIMSCLGRVNSTQFDEVWIYAPTGNPITPSAPITELSPNGGYPPETLLCQSVFKERLKNITGRVCWNLTYKFLYRDTGWNNFLASDGNFYLATFGGSSSGKRLYSSENLQILFTQPAPRIYQGPTPFETSLRAGGGPI